MSTLDRYIIRLLLANMAIVFVVVVSMFVLLDMITQFDEFVQAAAAQSGGPWSRAWSMLTITADYYWPMSFLLYTYVVGLLPVAAAGFTLTALLRNREVTAMLAGGVSMYRIALPIFVVGFILNLLMVANQELIQPNLAHKLTRKATHLRFEDQTRRSSLRFVPDGQGSLISASLFDPLQNKLSNVTILRREKVQRTDGAEEFGRAVERVTATQAFWDADRHGWELIGGEVVRRDVDEQAGGGQERRGIEFYATDLDPDTIRLREQSRYRQLLSLGQLGELINKARQTHALDEGELLRIRHSRFSSLVMNMLVLAMGLSFFLLRSPRNMFVQVIKCAGLCVGAWLGGIIGLQIAAGTLPPAAIAWMPVAIYLPVAYWLMDSVET